MQRITIGRYRDDDNNDRPVPPMGRDDIPNDVPQKFSDHYDGWIEGVRNDGSEWIMFIDSAGSPQVIWLDRDESGSAWGPPTLLRREQGRNWGTSDHPMTWQEMNAQPRSGTGTTDA